MEKPAGKLVLDYSDMGYRFFSQNRLLATPGLQVMVFKAGVVWQGSGKVSCFLKKSLML